jgi:hypothetical protein
VIRTGAPHVNLANQGSRRHSTAHTYLLRLQTLLLALLLLLLPLLLLLLPLLLCLQMLL